MGILTDDMRRMVDEQQLGFIATVCPDGTPNLSPKGTTAAWDDEHLVFADICSPGTIANLRHNPVLEINVVGPYPEDLCLDFVNTLLWRGRSEPVETLYSAADLFQLDRAFGGSAPSIHCRGSQLGA